MIKIKNEHELATMIKGGQILSAVFEEIKNYIQAGVNAAFLDNLIAKNIRDWGAQPSFLGFNGYKYSSCISLNEEVVHGLPHVEKILKIGDICSVDIGVLYDGYHVDAARTYILEPVSDEIRKLVRVTEEAFHLGAAQVRPGNRFGDIAFAMQKHVENNGFSMVRDLFSHGIGQSLHEEPLIANFGAKKSGAILKEGMTFALEPMVNAGSFEVLTLPDKWTIICADRKLSAHYEDTIYVSRDGAKILTKLEIK